MDSFIQFFFTGSNWFWHYLLLAFLCYLISPKIYNNNNGNIVAGEQGETPENDNTDQKETQGTQSTPCS